MPLQTTVVGSYPKPAYLQTPDWFKGKDDNTYSPDEYNKFVGGIGKKELESLQMKATREVIDEQTELGLSVITDGEMARENYVHHFCRRLKGFDFTQLTQTIYRDGACKMSLPTVIGDVEPLAPEPWCFKEWERAQKMTDVPVKMTIPGPMTITDSSHNSFYKDRRRQSDDLVKCINREVRALAQSGCKYIQIDEPVMVRNPAIAMEYGIDHVAQCFEGVGTDTFKVVHLCCGYPNHLDEEDYKKADKGAYLQLADQLDNAGFDAVSIEDAHRNNDEQLFRQFKKTTIILGVVAIARSKVETTEDIKRRVQEVLLHIPVERLWLAPDCGLGFLPRDVLRQKLRNMVLAANEL